jgi:hypothetical protein
LGGEVWGYNITLNNYYEEKEILLEPETKFVVESVYPVDDLINIIGLNIISEMLINFIYIVAIILS